MHVLVEVERGDHDDRERVVDVGSGELSGGLDAVHVGHADVEQADVGAEFAGEGHRFASVGSLAYHLDVGLGVEDHPETGADEVLIIGDDRADAHVTEPAFGSTALTVQPLSGLRPASRVPPRRVARSVMPTRP